MTNPCRACRQSGSLTQWRSSRTASSSPHTGNLQACNRTFLGNNNDDDDNDDDDYDDDDNDDDNGDDDNVDGDDDEHRQPAGLQQNIFRCDNDDDDYVDGDDDEDRIQVW